MLVATNTTMARGPSSWPGASSIPPPQVTTTSPDSRGLVNATTSRKATGITVVRVIIRSLRASDAGVRWGRGLPNGVRIENQEGVGALQTGTVDCPGSATDEPADNNPAQSRKKE